MKLNTLKDNNGASTTSNRVGRGNGCGNGKTCGRGHKGQKSRSGGNVMPGFEGGQMPLYRRLPIRGFNNFNFKKNFVTINLTQLQNMIDNKKLKKSETITLSVLQQAGFTKKTFDGLKVLGSGEVTDKISIDVQGISKSAQDKIEKAGGKVNVKPLNDKVTKFTPSRYSQNKAT